MYGGYHGTRWTNKEHRRLGRLLRADWPIRVIALHLRRTESAVKHRILSDLVLTNIFYLKYVLTNWS